MRGFQTGVIAGIFGGIWIFLYVLVFSMTEIPDITSLDFWLNYLIYQLGQQAIFGGIFGIIYSHFYKKIPGKGLKKGIVFGLMIGLLGNISYGSGHLLIGFLTANEKHLMWAVDWFASSSIWFVYGVVLGPLYERWK